MLFWDHVGALLLMGLHVAMTAVDVDVDVDVDDRQSLFEW